jgi:hypothetical protein
MLACLIAVILVEAVSWWLFKWSLIGSISGADTLPTKILVIFVYSILVALVRLGSKSIRFDDSKLTEEETPPKDDKH